jgi:ribose transport system permease protein
MFAATVDDRVMIKPGDKIACAESWQRLRLIGVALLTMPPSYSCTLALLTLTAVLRPALLSPELLFLILRQAAPLGLATIGQSLVMRVLSLDLSIGGVVVAVTYALTSGYLPEALLLPACLILGMGIGGVNGFLIVRFRASSVIVTLALAMILYGIVIALSQLHTPGDAPESLKLVGSGRMGILPNALALWLAVLLPAALLLRCSVFGNYLDAVGANPPAATLSGIPYQRIVFITHVLSGATAALSAFLLTGFVGIGSVMVGQDLPLNTVAACILGGVNFGSGRAGLTGPAVASFMLTFLFNLLASFGLGEPEKLMLQGAIIVVAALTYSMRQRDH